MMIDTGFLRIVRCTHGINRHWWILSYASEYNKYYQYAVFFFNRLNGMDGDSLVKQVYMELQRLAEQCFDSWVSSLCKLGDA